MIDMRFKRYHPGVIINDSIQALNMSNKEFSLRTGISERVLSDLLNGKSNLTFEIASKLADFFDVSINSWMNLQNSYDEYCLELQRKQEIEEDFDCLKPFKKYLLDNHIVNKEDKKDTIVEKSRKFFAINRIDALNTMDFVVSFKEQNSPKPNNQFAQNLWVAYALNESRKFQIKEYDRERLSSKILMFKELTTKEPEEFLPILKESLADCGVAFVVLPYLKQSGIYGFTKWLTSNKVVLAISNRSERADLFWFTFFHELAHVLAEHKRYFVMQYEKGEDAEANEFASNSLINKDKWKEFVEQKDYSITAIEKLAKKEKILPMIVASRLQKEKKLNYDQTYQYFYKSYQI